jgi:uncharacterized protein YacL
MSEYPAPAATGNDEAPGLIEDAGDKLDAANVSVRADMAQLAGDFREFISAEMQYYQARLKYSTSIAKWTGVYLAVALFAALGAIVALILGLLLIISAFAGPIWATLIVTVTFAGVGVLFAVLAQRTTRKFKFTELSERDD